MGAEMELCIDSKSAVFGITTSTEITNRSTINSQLGSASVSVDIHGERDKDIHVERNQSTESEDNHEDIVKRKKVQRGGRPTKKTNNKTNSNQSDFNKIQLIGSEIIEHEFISKQVKSRGYKGRFISKAQANDTNVNIVGENSGVSQSNDRVSRGREQRVHNTMAQNIKDTAIEKAKERKARMDKEKCRLNVEPRTQPLRGVVTENEFSYVNSSSEDTGLSSDDSYSPYQ